MSRRSLPVIVGLSTLLVIAAIAMHGLVSTWTASPGQISSERAAALALNRLVTGDAAIELHHPHHRATFTAQGVEFVPLRAGPSWGWRFDSISTSDGTRFEASHPAPERGSDDIVRYARGPVVEQYVPRAGSVEQQFVLPSPLELEGADLILTGVVETSGAFARTAKGWHWRDAGGAVTLGDVTVLDAQGRELPALLRVAKDSTRIEIDGTALASAAYPVTIDPEIGSDDLRISQMGADGDATVNAHGPGIAYNSTANEYLVVWQGDEQGDAEFEIWCQRVDADTGALLGSNFVISDVDDSQGQGTPGFQALDPAVAYNATDDEYLVVWRADDFDAADDEFEIYGQRLIGATGVEVGANDFRITTMGPNGNPDHDARAPAVAWDSTNDQYLVVWEGDDALDAFEIYGQLIDGSGNQIGVNDFRISDMGSDDAATEFGAFRPDVVYSEAQDQYLVVWDGDDDTGALVDGEFEIYGQILTALSGAEVGGDLRISQMGTDGNHFVGARNAAVTLDPLRLNYLVVWEADDLVNDEFEIYGQLIDAITGQPIGNDDFRISDMGPDGNPEFGALRPDVAYSSGSDEYLVVWEGDEVNGETDIYGQRLTGETASEHGSNDEPLSEMGPVGNVLFDGFRAAIASDPGATGYLVVWEGDQDANGLVNDEFEIYAQQVPEPGSLLMLAAGVLGLMGLSRGRAQQGRRV